jgi:signal transduction histidine kinase
VERSLRRVISTISDREGLEVEVDLRGLEIYTDTLIDRVFYDLINNTIKHAKTATRISFSCKTTEKETILICEDNGIGIPLLKKDKIFCRIVAGEGHFGLFFVSEYLSLFGISITETGMEGNGARFEILIPLKFSRFPIG